MSLILDGTAGITFNNATTQASAGQVLQVVQTTFPSSSLVTTTSTSFVTSGHSATITPKFSTSKILVICTASVVSANPYWGGAYTIYRGSTNLGLSGTNGFAGISSNINPFNTLVYPLSMSYQDSPATTSSTTYTIYMASQSGSFSVGYGNSAGGFGTLSTITLMEIAA
jgi:hypothetical protein